ncbi:Uncharacterized protein dnm_071870 [Desulfonema magnum]|uniref:Uncharacterized protein n=1 Tax=Desulfonema magnum TaxID=45655 RepID=A0A975GRP4_9BACT|nr:Uncharacterized protein dnm_071870 [Desulfonema magnum]
MERSATHRTRWVALRSTHPRFYVPGFRVFYFGKILKSLIIRIKQDFRSCQHFGIYEIGGPETSPAEKNMCFNSFFTRTAEVIKSKEAS